MGEDCYDHDAEFAKASGIQFYTPELYLEGSDERLEAKEENKQEIREDKWQWSKPEPPKPDTIERIKGGKAGDELNLTKGRPTELIIAVGGPGSGKTTFIQKYLADYHRVFNESDKPYLITGCRLGECKRTLTADKSVVVDLLSGTKAHR